MQSGWVEVDGSRGEGGGQILRSALALSLIARRPMHMTRIRPRRSKPGLMPQHVTAVAAAAAVGDAAVEGAVAGSDSLRFAPRRLRGGDLRFDIRTAGSAPLVVQTVLTPLSLASEGSRLTVTGGTHVPGSPSFHYLALQWLPHARQIGVNADLLLELAGCYPRGGGEMSASVRPASPFSPLRIVERGRLRRVRGISAVADLDMRIAERQKRQAIERLQRHCRDFDIDVVRLPARSPGTTVLLIAEFDHSRCAYSALGARGKPAERVADEAADGLEEFLATDGAIDPYLADQLVLPLALARGVSELRTSKITSHLVTNAEVVRLFLPARIDIEGDIGAPGLIRIEGTGTPG